MGDYIDHLAPASEASATAAEEIGRIEAQIRHFVDEGTTLAEAHKRLGYHQLQTKR